MNEECGRISIVFQDIIAREVLWFVDHRDGNQDVEQLIDYVSEKIDDHPERLEGGEGIISMLEEFVIARDNGRLCTKEVCQYRVSCCCLNKDGCIFE